MRHVLKTVLPAGLAGRRHFQSKILWPLFLCLLPLLSVQNTLSAQSSSQPTDSLLFREGEILLSKGETEKALWRFKRLITESPKSPLLNEAKFRMGICYTQLKRPKEAIQVLNELFSTFLSPMRMRQVFTLLGDNALELKDPYKALQWYGKGLLLPKQPQDELKKKVASIIDPIDEEEELTRIASLYRGAYAGGYAKLKLADLMKRRGNDLLAKRIMTEWNQEYHEFDYVSHGKVPSEALRTALKTKYAIGIILPLSGIHRPFGERVLQGIQLAVKQSEPQGKSSLVSFTIRDSKGNPTEAAKAVEELVAKEKVVAIIGPLLTVTVDGAVKKAETMKVPLLTLSQKEPLSGLDNFVFQNSLLPSSQMEALVTYAMEELRLRTFAVFYPGSPYGPHFKNLFTQEVHRRGGKIRGVVTYQEDQKDFGLEIKNFFRITRTPRESSRLSKGELMTDFSMDGVFIPDTHDRVGLILSQMSSLDVSGLTFLGTSAWNGPGLISVGGKSSEGAVFVDTFFKQASSPQIMRFMEEFRKTYHREPETLEALGYDGARILLEILRSKEISSPVQLRDELRKAQDFQGVSGLNGFGENGKTIRTLSILRVKNGQIVQVAPQ